MHIFKDTHYDFMRWRWHAIALSWVVILAGLGLIATRGLAKGLEFAGGTAIIAQFDQTPAIDAVRRALDTNFPGGGENTVVQAYGDPSQRQVMVRVPQVGAESGGSLSTTASTIEDALKKG